MEKKRLWNTKPTVAVTCRLRLSAGYDKKKSDIKCGANCGHVATTSDATFLPTAHSMNDPGSRSPGFLDRLKEQSSNGWGTLQSRSVWFGLVRFL